ncbi:MAG: GNAT family N-acetyltransferase [Candidatus Bathyarchaeota archaeon]|nr:GNAT family N-acetyltransferase [Candidatus Bathyarchaeota archaeon]
MSFVVRKYRDADLEECRFLWHELTEWHREIYQDSTIGGEHPEDYFDKYLARFGREHLWVAVDDSKVVGLVGLIVEENEAEIEPIIVSRSYHGKGIGRKLVEQAVSEARQMKVRFLSVRPVVRNIQTIRFLYKQGFQNLGHVELFIDFSKYVWRQEVDLFGCGFKF